MDILFFLDSLFIHTTRNKDFTFSNKKPIAIKIIIIIIITNAQKTLHMHWDIWGRIFFSPPDFIHRV